MPIFSENFSGSARPSTIAITGPNVVLAAGRDSSLAQVYERGHCAVLERSISVEILARHYSKTVAISSHTDVIPP